MCNKKDWSLSLSEQASLCAEWHEFLLEIYLKILPNIREATKLFFTAVYGVLGMQHLSGGRHFSNLEVV